MRRFHEGYGLKEEPGSGSKLKLDALRLAYGLDQSSFSAIVRVNEPNYVPECVQLRVRLGPKLFTAQIEPPDLDLLERDDRVVSISASKPLTRLG